MKSRETNLVTRRRFLAHSAFGLGALSATSLPFDASGGSEATDSNRGHNDANFARDANKLGTVIGAGRFQASDKTTFIVSLVDLDAKSSPMQNFPIDFFGHGIVFHPHDPVRAVVFEKKGKGACEVDLKRGVVLRTIETKPEREFYGHGAYSADAKLLYCTETDIEDNYRGLIAVRDGKTMKLLGEFPSHGLSPHDCVLIDDGATMAITNAGGDIGTADAPCVTYVDVKTEALVEKVKLGSARINAGHLFITSKKDLAVVSAPREGMEDKAQQLGGVSLRPAGKPLQTMTDPSAVTQRLIGETLSVAVHEPTRTVAATTPAANLITFWNLDSGKLVKSMPIEYPRGVTLTRPGDEFVFSYGKAKSNIVRVDARSLKPNESSRLENIGIGGSHLFRYDTRG